MREELEFAEHLSKKGISYLPIFLGFRDASLEVGQQGVVSWKANRKLDKWGNDLIESRFKCGVHRAIQSLLRQYRPRFALFPLGINHADHVFLRRVGEMTNGPRVRFYLDVPYSCDYNDLQEIQQATAATNCKVHSRKFDYGLKRRLFSRIYHSQYNDTLSMNLKKAVPLGECLFDKTDV